MHKVLITIDQFIEQFFLLALEIIIQVNFSTMIEEIIRIGIFRDIEANCIKHIIEKWNVKHLRIIIASLKNSFMEDIKRHIELYF